MYINETRSKCIKQIFESQKKLRKINTMERILVFGYYNSGQKRKNDDEKSIHNENTPCSKKAKFNGGQEKCARDSGKSNAIAQTGNFGKMILPDRETVVIDKKTVLSFTQKKKNVDLESHEVTDSDLSADEEQQAE